jgi:uncharacterized membrane protein YccC
VRQRAQVRFELRPELVSASVLRPAQVERELGERGSATRARLREHLTGRLSCWRSVAVPVVQTALAAGLSWFVAVHLFGHRAPLFAPVAAIVSIDLTLGQRLHRAIELIVGASVGVGVSALLISAIGTGPWQVAVVVALATSVAVLGGDQRSGSGVSNPRGDVVRAG